MCTMLVSHRVIHGQMAPQDIRYILRSEPRHGDIFFSFICRKIIKGYLILISLVYLHKDNRKLSHFLYPSFICAKVIKSYFPLQAFSRSTPHLTRARHPFQLSLLLSKSSHRLYHCPVFAFCLCLCICRTCREILKCHERVEMFLAQRIIALFHYRDVLRRLLFHHSHVFSFLALFHILSI